MITKGQKFINRKDGNTRKVTKVVHDRKLGTHQVFLSCIDCRVLSKNLIASWDMDSFLRAVDEGYWIEVK